jgi:hypothetical protein
MTYFTGKPNVITPVFAKMKYVMEQVFGAVRFEERYHGFLQQRWPLLFRISNG